MGCTPSTPAAATQPTPEPQPCAHDTEVQPEVGVDDSEENASENASEPNQSEAAEVEDLSKPQIVEDLVAGPRTSEGNEGEIAGKPAAPLTTVSREDCSKDGNENAAIICPRETEPGETEAAAVPITMPLNEMAATTIQRIWRGGCTRHRLLRMRTALLGALGKLQGCRREMCVAEEALARVQHRVGAAIEMLQEMRNVAIDRAAPSEAEVEAARQVCEEVQAAALAQQQRSEKEWKARCSQGRAKVEEGEWAMKIIRAKEDAMNMEKGAMNMEKGAMNMEKGAMNMPEATPSEVQNALALIREGQDIIADAEKQYQDERLQQTLAKVRAQKGANRITREGANCIEQKERSKQILEEAQEAGRTEIAYATLRHSAAQSTLRACEADFEALLVEVGCGKPSLRTRVRRVRQANQLKAIFMSSESCPETKSTSPGQSQAIAEQTEEHDAALAATAMFNMFDKDGSGQLSRAEIVSIIGDGCCDDVLDHVLEEMGGMEGLRLGRITRSDFEEYVKNSPSTAECVLQSLHA